MLYITVAMILMSTHVLCDLPQEWAYQVTRDTSITLTCNDTSIMIDSTEYGEWTTPEGKLLPKTHNDSVLRVMRENDIDGFSLLVKKVSQPYEGVYICTVKNESTDTIRMTSIRGINIHEMLTKSTSDLYNHNIIVAVIAALVFFVPFVGVCAIYKFRYKPPEDKEKKYNVRHIEYPNNVSMETPAEYKVQPSDTGYDNVAASVTDSTASTKL